MPRRNIAWLFIAIVVCLVCYQKAPSNRYGRALAGAMDYVSRRYYMPVDDRELFEGAMEGMIGRLDKNSAYIPVAEKQEFQEDVTKQFGGVGINVVLDSKNKQLTVVAAIPGTPAIEAGIRPGDRIVKIDGHSTQGMSLADAVERMHGKPNTPVTLAIVHAGGSRPVELTLMRRVIEEETVEGAARNPDGSWDFRLADHPAIGVLHITGFAEAEKSDEAGNQAKTTVADLKQAIDGLRRRRLDGLVLDLRDNRGGSLRAAIDVCDLFIRKGVIVTTRGRDGRILRSFQATKTAPYTDFPVAVIVNQNSASAAEIVAACLQDHHRAVVVGQRSFGKGTVQEVTDMGDPLGALKLTIATYWRPSGQNIHRSKDDAKDATWGVTPDEGYQVIVDEQEQMRLERWQIERELTGPGFANGAAAANDSKGPLDRPLAKAVEYLEKAGKK